MSRTGTMVKERPILFSGPMVRAILDGRKTQTRRLVKPQSMFDGKDEIVRRFPNQSGHRFGEPGDRLRVNESFRVGVEYDSDPPRDVEPISIDGKDISCSVWYEANGKPKPETGWGRLRPGRFMMGWMSRLTLEVVSVRVERVQDITEADAIAEGFADDEWLEWREWAESVAPPGESHIETVRERFLHTFYDLNERAPRDTNPWVWVVTFRRIANP